MNPAAPLAVDVVIPFRAWDVWVGECVQAALAMEPPCQQVTLVPDAPLEAAAWEAIRQMPQAARVREIPSGALNPGRKRNLAMGQSQADVFGFVDSDARPWRDWLAHGLPHFQDPTIAIVGGPNLTAPEDDSGQQACGDVMASPVGMGAGYIRHVPVSLREVDELPTCNMLVRARPEFRFRPELDTSEDMVFCQEVRQQGWRIRYDPCVGIWHHRRRLGLPFWRQFFHYGVYQGRRIQWRWLWRAAPLGLIFHLVALPVLVGLRPALWAFWLAPLAGYAAIIVVESIRLARGKPRGGWTLLAFPIAHLAYGSGYIRGFWQTLRKST